MICNFVSIKNFAFKLYELIQVQRFLLLVYHWTLIIVLFSTRPANYKPRCTKRQPISTNCRTVHYTAVDGDRASQFRWVLADTAQLSPRAALRQSSDDGVTNIAVDAVFKQNISDQWRQLQGFISNKLSHAEHQTRYGAYDDVDCREPFSRVFRGARHFVRITSTRATTLLWTDHKTLTHTSCLDTIKAENILSTDR